MRGIDGTSWKYDRSCLVAFFLQVRKHVVERHTDEPSNVLSNDPTGPNTGNDSQHLRPESAVIFRAQSLPGARIRLAGEAAGEQIGSSVLRSIEVEDVGNDRDAWPSFRQYFPTELVSLTEDLGVIARPVGGQSEAADAGEQIDVGFHGAARNPTIFRCRTSANTGFPIKLT